MLLSNCSGIALELPRICPEFAPKLHQNCTKIAPKLHQNFNEFAPNLHRICTEFAPKLQWNCSEIALKLLCYCTKVALKLPWSKRRLFGALSSRSLINSVAKLLYGVSLNFLCNWDSIETLLRSHQISAEIAPKRALRQSRHSRYNPTKQEVEAEEEEEGRGERNQVISLNASISW